MPAVRLEASSLLKSHGLLAVGLLLAASPLLLMAFPVALLPVASMALHEGLSAHRRLAGRSLYFDGETWCAIPNLDAGPDSRITLSLEAPGLCLGWLLAWRLREGPAVHRLLLLPGTVSREQWRNAVLAVRCGSDGKES